MGSEHALSVEQRVKLRETLLSTDNRFIIECPKIELHVHIEGTLSPSIRWKLAQRNGTTLRLAKNTTELKTLQELEAAIDSVRPEAGQDNTEETVRFFQAYYEGFEVLKTKQDFFDLAMYFFERAAEMNVRYCEPFFDPQGHIGRGVAWDDMMGGFRDASIKAERELNVKSAWIMCFLRDLSPESAMEHYTAALPYRDIIVGIGLDSNEYDRPPSLFEEVFARARRDGFKLTMHCDYNQKDSEEHIRQCASVVASGGLERIDHGLNAADQQSLMDLIRKRDVGMTICPWSYLRRQSPLEIGPKIRTLYEAGIKMTINSDDPAYMEDCWILHNWLLVKHLCGFDDGDVAVMARNAVEISWAEQSVKEQILREINLVGEKYHRST